jgi:hypothetical protein
MVLLGDKDQLEACFGPFRDSDNLDARLVHGLRQTYHRLRNCFAHPLELLGTWVMWNVNLVRLEAVLVSVQDRCTVCAKCTTGSEIILVAPDGTPR